MPIYSNYIYNLYFAHRVFPKINENFGKKNNENKESSGTIHGIKWKLNENHAQIEEKT